MSQPHIPQNLSDFLYRRLAALHPNARLVFVFDPPGRLSLGDSLTVEGRTWAVHHYEGNDLAFRARFTLGDRALIWATCPTDLRPGLESRLELSSVVDLLAQADTLFDLSLVGVLQDLVPSETWPPEAVDRHDEVLSANLPAVVQGQAQLRLHLPRGAALDAHAIRALALHARQPDLPIGDLLFHKDTSLQVLNRYIRLAWEAKWDAAGRDLLREQARLSPQVSLGDLTAWLDAPPDALASYLYLRRLLGQHRVPNIANQLRGLGVLSFDPEPLEPWVDHVLARWEKDAVWRQQVIVAAEESLSDTDLRHAVDLLPGKDTQAVLTALARAEAPALVYELATRLLMSTPKDRLDGLITAWPQYRPGALSNLPPSRYAAYARDMAGFLDEAAFVVERLSRPFSPSPDLAGILDWYVDGGYYDLEFACARAAGYLRRLPDHALAETLRKDYLDGLRQRIRDFLHQADEELARRIQENWGGYLGHPRLSTNVLWNLVRQRRLRPQAKACLWVVIFDGMRWDTWQRVVKPRLLQLFELDEAEKAYLSLLPSWTTVARASILAGQPPVRWKRPDGGFTTNQKLLVARLFEIPASEVDHRLQFYSGMEADRTYSQLSREARYPWNVLIFNISDDNLHQERDNLEGLNKGIGSRLESIMQTLETLVQSEDMVVLTSDHGFMELDAADGVVVEEDARWQREAQGLSSPVRFRYLTGMEHPAGISVKHAPLRESPFTVAVGRRWFRRAGDNRPPARYAHGGLSLAEMAVPGAVLRRIVEPRIEIVIVQAPPAVQADEGQTITVEIVLENKGNQAAAFSLVARANTDTAPPTFQATLAPGERYVLRPSICPIYREKGTSTTGLNLELRYQDVQGNPVSRHKLVLVTVRPRTDMVEIQFGGLDELDAMA
ncbi:MAG: PglZ domain-containing protein [Anaerolineae bacterium]